MNNNNNILVSPPRFVIARAIIGGTLVNYSKLGLEVLPGKRFEVRATGRSRSSMVLVRGKNANRSVIKLNEHLGTVAAPASKPRRNMEASSCR